MMALLHTTATYHAGEWHDVFRMSHGGRSESTPVTSYKKYKDKAEAALNEIMQTLSSQGWQLNGKYSDGWWEYKYQR